MVLLFTRELAPDDWRDSDVAGGSARAMLRGQTGGDGWEGLLARH